MSTLLLLAHAGEQSESPWPYSLFTLLSAGERFEWEARSLPVLSATEECALCAFPRCSTWGQGGNCSISLTQSSNSPCHPNSRTVGTSAKFTSVLLATPLLAPGRNSYWCDKTAESANFYLNAFIKSNFRGTWRVKLLTLTSRTKYLLCHVKREKGSQRGWQVQWISKESNLQECLLLSFVFYSVRKKGPFQA